MVGYHIHPVLRRVTITPLLLFAGFLAAPLVASETTEVDLERKFTGTVRPFVDTYCITCHGKEKPKADFDLSPYSTVDAVVRDHGHWELVLEKLQAAEMPPEKAKQHPAPKLRKDVIEWLHALRRHEAKKNAGDPGPVLARRLSNAEYDYTIRDLTGVDIRPTKEFPVDPANQAGFDNSGESLAMSPALVKKYLQAARTVADHLVLKPEGFAFAPHPVVADTDRDKYSVLRIVDFYKRQPTDYADYFAAAWRFKNRAALGKSKATLADIAAEAKVSPKYLALIWQTLAETKEELGPMAKLQTMWRALPAPKRGKQPDEVRSGCEEMRDFVVQLRAELTPMVKNLSGPQMNEGSQTLVLWKNRQMAMNRRRYDPLALRIEGAALVDESAANRMRQNTRTNKPSDIPEIVRKGGIFLPPALTTTVSSATFKMAAAKKRGDDRDLIVPADPVVRAKYEAAFARFAEVFPDAFYITERARVYLDAQKETENAGRLLSAGLHSMTGYFRDDGPLCDLVLDDAGRRELDRLWQEFDFASSVPQRMHTSFVWFERTDSRYMSDAEFDPYRPEDKSIMAQEKIKKLGAIYLAKAQRNNATDEVQQAIKEHFEIVAANVLRVEQQRVAAEPSHLKAIEVFAERAYRRPLSQKEREGLQAFYRESREENGLEHEEAMRDCIVSVLMSPNFCYRVDLVEAAGERGRLARTGRRPADQPERSGDLHVDSKFTRERAIGGTPMAATGTVAIPNANIRPLSDYALASRLSYFLWSSMPDEELLARAAAGDLHRPEVLKTQVRRMTTDTRIRNFAVEFAGNWLDVRRFEEHNSVDRERFPSFDNALRSAMFEEPIHFFVDVVREDRSALNFLYGDYTFVNAPLARHYGIPLPRPRSSRREEAPSTQPAGSQSLLTSAATVGSEEWFRIERADRFGRGGLLPMSVFLTANSPGLRTSPVKRGYWVVRRVLGERIPPPPAVVPVLPNDEKNLGDLTLREVLAKHREDKSCASCHARFDSFGLVFEGYGPVGERRTKDFAGRAIDTRAEFPGGSEGNGLEGLRRYVRKHRQDDFVDNLCRKLLAYGLGRTLILSDDSTLQEMRAKLAKNEYRFGTLVESIVTSPQFLNKRVPDDLAKQ
jgi:hypothetical protein